MKKTIVAIVLISFCGILANQSFAAETKALSVLKNIGTSATGAAGTLLTIITVVVIVRQLASALVFHAGSLLDMAFSWNTENIFANTVSHGPILLFWGYSRDIANAFLILILLWIAFGIIFNLEKVNGKKLFVRVILVGLFINFSLTMVSTVFQFSNAIAKPFADQLRKTNSDPKGGISAKIIEITNVQTVFNSAGETAKKLGQQTEQSPGVTPTVPNAVSPVNESGSENENFAYNTLPQTAPAGTGVLGTQDAKAVLPVLLAPAAWGAVKLVGGIVAVDLINSFLQQFVLGQFDGGSISGFTSGGIIMALNPLVGTFFLLLTVFVLGSLALIFIARGIVIMLLGILAPLAFLSAIIPGQEKYWKQWLESLIKWSFFAPICFFLLLFTLYFGEQLQLHTTDSAARSTELQANLPAAFQLILIFSLLISSLVVARKMGIELAGTLMNTGGKWMSGGLGFATGVATGFGRKLFYPTAGELAAGAEKAIGGIKSPFLRSAFGFPASGLRRVSKLARETVKESGKGLQGLTAKEIKRALSEGAYLTKADRTAAVMRLRDDGELKLDKNIPGFDFEHLREAVDLLRNTGGEFMSILKANPTIARPQDFSPTEIADSIEKLVNKIPGFESLSQQNKGQVAAQAKVWEKIDPGAIQKVDSSAFEIKDSAITFNGKPMAQGDLTKELFLHFGKAGHYSSLGRSQPDTALKLNEYLNTPRGKDIIKEMNSGAYNWFNSTAARSVGVTLPPDHEPPREHLIEELGINMKRLKDEVDRIKRFQEMEEQKSGSAKKSLDKAVNNVVRLRAEYQVNDARLTARGGTRTPDPLEITLLEEAEKIQNRYGR